MATLLWATTTYQGYEPDAKTPIYVDSNGYIHIADVDSDWNTNLSLWYTKSENGGVSFDARTTILSDVSYNNTGASMIVDSTGDRYIFYNSGDGL